MKPWLYLGVALAIGILLGCEEEEPAFAAVGHKVPDKAVESFAKPGKDTSPRDFKGKVVLIDFWATWCGPCKAFMPTVRGLRDEFGPKGLEVMSVTDEDRSVVTKFEKKMDLGLPVYLDTFLFLHKAFQVDSIPHIGVIDREGTVVYDGVAEPKAIRAAIVKALG